MMLAKIILILWIISNLYVLIRVNKSARQEILWSLGIVKRNGNDKVKTKPLDDNKAKPVKKRDLSKECRKNKYKCDSGKGCMFSNSSKVSECDVCECYRCFYGACLPALKG